MTCFSQPTNKYSNIAFVTSAEQQFEGFLSRKEFPLFSPSYEKKQCLHYKIIREIVVNEMTHNPNEH